MLENSKTILCVNRNTDAWDVLTATFPGLKFTFTDSVATSLDLIYSRDFDLYLLDERSSGIELCRLIRAVDANTPILVLSPAGHTPDQTAAFAAGASWYLDMPRDRCLLESAVMSLLGRAGVINFTARMAEIAAIRDEVKAHLEEIDDRMKECAETARYGLSSLLRARAYATFINSGGVRSRFETSWNEVVGDSQEELQ